MDHGIDSSLLVGLLVDLSIKAAVFAAVVELGLRALRVKDAALSHSMWVAVACGMLLFPGMRLYLPTIEIPLLPATLGAADPYALVDPAWGPVLVGVYVGGALALLARLFVGLAVGARLVADSRPVRDGRWTDLAIREVPARPWRRQLELRESDRVRVPMTIGFTRPVVLLPVGWREWDARKVKSVLAHELAHARRGDFAWQLVGELNLCFFWFHPVAWLLQRRVSLAAERACDDSAILAVGDHCAYARHLVDVASALQGRRGRVVAVGIPMAQPCQIRSRVEAILDRDRRRSIRLGRAAAVFVVVLASVVWVSAASVCWQRTAAATHSDSQIACPDEAAASSACPNQ
jgi:beta-lactamase regulating signal transducer with metallopeptidase domain